MRALQACSAGADGAVVSPLGSQDTGRSGSAVAVAEAANAVDGHVVVDACVRIAARVFC